VTDRRIRVTRRKGVNAPLIYRVSGDCNRRAREFDPRTHEGVSCERCWYLSPSLRLRVEGTNKEKSHTFVASRVSAVRGNESRVFDSRTREIASCKRVTLVTNI
jgi:hypothetical protein